MKVDITYKFNLEDTFDKEDYKCIQKAKDSVLALHEIDNILRRYTEVIECNPEMKADELLDKLKGSYYNCLEDYGIVIEDLIS